MNRLPALSLRLRLTLLSAGIGLLCTGALVAVVVAVLTAQLNVAVDRDLAREVAEYQHAVSHTRDLKELAAAAEAFLREDQPTGGTVAFYRIELADGTVLTNSTDERLLGLLERRRGGGQGFMTLSDPAFGDFRVADSRILQNGEPVGEFRVATPLAPAERTVQQLVGPLFGIGVTLVGLAAAVAYLLLGRTLRPLRWIQHTAEAIEESDLSRRIGHVGPPDDVGKLAATFDAMLDRLEESFRERQAFYALASHELRTPLTIVRGHLEVLRRNPAPSVMEVQEALDVALEEVRRLIVQVNDMLLLGRMLLQQTAPARPVDVARLLRDVHRKAVKLADRDWRVTTCPAHVRGDPEQLERALMNLVMNAIAHTRLGDQVEISGHRHLSTVVLSVQDSGRGVPLEDRSRIFELGFRGRNARADGAGLGLALVRSVARAHGGEVGVSGPGSGGACFALRLPAMP